MRRPLASALACISVLVPGAAWAADSPLATVALEGGTDCEYAWLPSRAVSATVDRRAVRIDGLRTGTVRVTARIVQDPKMQPGHIDLTADAWKSGVLGVVETKRQVGTQGFLKRVSAKNGVSVWQGDLVVTGASRTVSELKFAVPGGLGSWCIDLPAAKIRPITVKSTNTPVLTLDPIKTVDVRAKTYTLTGRVLTTQGRAYGKPIKVGVGRRTGPPDEYFYVRTDARGRFRAVLPNKPDTRGAAPVTSQLQEVFVWSSRRDSVGDSVRLAAVTPRITWTTSLPVKAPAQVRLGETLNVTSSAPVPVPEFIDLERLDGRTWTQIGSAMPRGSGRVTVPAKADALGRHVYRLRVRQSEDWPRTGSGVSKTFIVTTTR